MRFGDLRPLLRRHVDDEDPEVLVAEEELRPVGRPLGVVGGPVEARRERFPRLARSVGGRVADVELVLAGPVGEEGDLRPVGREAGEALAALRRARQVAGPAVLVRRDEEEVAAGLERGPLPVIGDRHRLDRLLRADGPLRRRPTGRSGRRRRPSRPSRWRRPSGRGRRPG